jgi:hypothetical protein
MFVLVLVIDANPPAAARTGFDSAHFHPALRTPFL